MGANLVWAQAGTGFSVGRFESSEPGSRFVVGDTLDLRDNLRPAIKLTTDFAHRPLVVYDAGGTERVALVSDQLITQLGVSVTFGGRVRVGGSLPMTLLSNGDVATASTLGLRAPQSRVGLGDARISADVRLLGHAREPFTLAAGMVLLAPTGETDQYSSDGTFRAQARVLVAGELNAFLYSSRVGFHFRPQYAPLGAPGPSNELSFSAAAGFQLLSETTLISAEFFGSTSVNAQGRASTPMEILFGLHYRFVEDWQLSVAGGPGIGRGTGTPQLRVVASLGFAPRAVEERPRGDWDLDGITDRDDACDTEAGPAHSNPQRHGCPDSRL